MYSDGRSQAVANRPKAGIEKLQFTATLPPGNTDNAEQLIVVANSA